ncbi:hypothetical protein, partial [Hydrotalea sp.]
MNTTTKFFKRAVLFTIPLFLLLSFQCNKNDTRPCIFNSYSFAVTSEWSPQKETYNVGDTIFLSSTFPKTLPDLVNPSLTIDYSNSTGIGGAIGIAAPDSLQRTNKPAKDSFQFVSIIGSFSERTGNKNISINFIESSSSYQFKGGIICKKKGLFGISVDNLRSRGIRGKNCTNAGFNMNVTNSNKYILPYQNALGIILDAESLK